LKRAIQSENLKIVAAGRRLNLAAVRAEKCGVVVSYRTRPTCNRHSGIEDFNHI
jgi:hypothetical protein